MRLTDAAVADLERMVRKGDPQVVRWALKKCLLLERNPEAGEELRGALIGYRELTVGDGAWRIVWRVTHDDAGHPVVDVAEVWALGARSDSEVYAEMRDRVATLTSPSTLPLKEAIERLGKVAAGLTATSAEPGEDGEADQGAEPAQLAVPEWLVQALVKVVGMPRADVDRLSQPEAQRLWSDFTSTPR